MNKVVEQRVNLQDNVEEYGGLYKTVDDSDLLAGNMNDLGCIILEETAEHCDVTTQ